MNDQERITDFLNSEKKMSLNYGIFASECVSVPLRDEFLKLINQSHQTQTQLFTTAQSKGWYSPEQAHRIRLPSLHQVFKPTAHRIRKRREGLSTVPPSCRLTRKILQKRIDKRAA